MSGPFESPYNLPASQVLRNEAFNARHQADMTDGSAERLEAEAADKRQVARQLRAAAEAWEVAAERLERPSVSFGVMPEVTMLCCPSHQAAGCCDTDDCGPCCPACPTCPKLNASSALPTEVEAEIAASRHDSELEGIDGG